jgi:hypothetical protein
LTSISKTQAWAISGFQDKTHAGIEFAKRQSVDWYSGLNCFHGVDGRSGGATERCPTRFVVK